MSVSHQDVSHQSTTGSKTKTPTSQEAWEFLHPLEIKILRHFKKEQTFTTNILLEALSYNLGQANQALNWLSFKGLVILLETQVEQIYEQTDLGKHYQNNPLPHEQILQTIQKKSLSIQELSLTLSLEQKDLGSAFGFLSKNHLVYTDAQNKIFPQTTTPNNILSLLRTLLNSKTTQWAKRDLNEEQQKVLATFSSKRSDNLYKLTERKTEFYQLSKLGLLAQKFLQKRTIDGEELGELTQEILKKGSWKSKNFRAFDLNMPPSRILLGHKNPYGDFLFHTKQTLASLGFQEIEGPMIESEFWNNDALFMPQFHPARDTHNVYYVQDVPCPEDIPQKLLERVQKIHEKGTENSQGWQYQFDPTQSRRSVLRTQGTALSARQLYLCGEQNLQGKFFGMARCFRYDQVDATHAPDFYQTEGIIVEDNMNLGQLLGLLKMFAQRVVGAKKFHFVPAYFPFTEPSIEIHVFHPKMGWFEMGGSGILRPEVTEAFGINKPVLAWGLGLDRMALLKLGLQDIRELFTYDLDSVRLGRARHA